MVTFKVISDKKGFTTIFSNTFSIGAPDLPSYQAFNHRLNELGESLRILVYELMTNFPEGEEFFTQQDAVIDSLPIMLAVRGRAGSAKVAPDEANVGYCASKDIFYHGVKMHTLGEKTISAVTVT